MKKTHARGAIALALLVVAPAFAAEKTVTLAVSDMSCAACPGLVKRTLGRVDGVKSIAMRTDVNEAVVIYDDSKTNPEALVDVTTFAGYPTAVKHP